jgi:hypothetical protein
MISINPRTQQSLAASRARVEHLCNVLVKTSVARGRESSTFRVPSATAPSAEESKSVHPPSAAIELSRVIVSTSVPTFEGGTVPSTANEDSKTKPRDSWLAFERQPDVLLDALTPVPPATHASAPPTTTTAPSDAKPAAAETAAKAPAPAATSSGTLDSPRLAAQQHIKLHPRASFGGQCLTLLRRGATNAMRDRSNLWALLLDTLVSALLAGWIFWGTDSLTGLQNKSTLLYQFYGARTWALMRYHTYRLSPELLVFDRVCLSFCLRVCGWSLLVW